jgi:toxin YoeB
MKYEIILTDLALEGIRLFKKSGDLQALRKLDKLLSELEDHPKTGTGQVEAQKGNKTGLWSRRITPKHRLVYMIEERKVSFVVISTYGHYGEK